MIWFIHTFKWSSNCFRLKSLCTRTKNKWTLNMCFALCRSRNPIIFIARSTGPDVNFSIVQIQHDLSFQVNHIISQNGFGWIGIRTNSASSIQITFDMLLLSASACIAVLAVQLASVVKFWTRSPPCVCECLCAVSVECEMNWPDDPLTNVLVYRYTSFFECCCCWCWHNHRLRRLTVCLDCDVWGSVLFMMFTHTYTSLFYDKVEWSGRKNESCLKGIIYAVLA